MLTISDFVDALAVIKSETDFYNPYTDIRKAKNLALYLSYMAENPPEYLFVGEAPGYKGCALTGVPFTDEFHLSANGNLGCLPLQNTEYTIVSENPHKEISASVIWGILKEARHFPLMWNAFPFHPHKNNNPNTNRTPTSSEIEKYGYFVKDLVELFPKVKTICAIGRKAEIHLANIGIEGLYVRHPSRGGQAECRKRLTELFAC